LFQVLLALKCNGKQVFAHYTRFHKNNFLRTQTSDLLFKFCLSIAQSDLLENEIFTGFGFV